MSDTAPDSTRPDPPSIYSAQLFDVTPDCVRVEASVSMAYVRLGPLSVHGPVRLSSDVVEQLVTLRDIGAAIVAQTTAAIEQRAHVEAAR